MNDELFNEMISQGLITLNDNGDLYVIKLGENAIQTCPIDEQYGEISTMSKEDYYKFANGNTNLQVVEETSDLKTKSKVIIA